MENPDKIEQKFKSTFSNFEQEPPAEVWENLQKVLHPDPKPQSIWKRISASNFYPDRYVQRYIAFASVALILILAVVYIASDDDHSIKGRAYAGEVRLSSGIAVLFRVNDKVKPWDSVKHYKSAIINRNGLYSFSGVEPGTYLLRIAPDRRSEAAKQFLPSWFDQHENPDSSHVIIIGTEDVNADVHLIAKESISN